MSEKLYSMTKRSGNRKTGPIPVSMSARSTCPDTCAFRGNGCYADAWPLALHWNRLSNGKAKRALTWSGLLDAVRRLAPGQLWRHNQAGDLPHDNGRIDVVAVLRLVLANNGRRGFTYTHHETTGRHGVHNVDAIQAANDGGLTVNVSADSPAGVDAPMALGLPTVAVLPATAGKVTTTPQGRRIVTCPATYQDTGPLSACATCGLCQQADRTYAIGFPVHGNGRKKAAAVVAQLDGDL